MASRKNKFIRGTKYLHFEYERESIINEYLVMLVLPCHLDAFIPSPHYSVHNLTAKEVDYALLDNLDMLYIT